MEIARNLGPVLEKCIGNSYQISQRFCIALTTGDPFLLVIEVVNPINGKVSHINVDYSNLPIRCRHCLSTRHLVKDWPTSVGRDSQNSERNRRAEGNGGVVPETR